MVTGTSEEVLEWKSLAMRKEVDIFDGTLKVNISRAGRELNFALKEQC